jgi:MOSC domain-containing protein YiiM
MPWGIFGENITIEGLNEEDVNIGDIFKIGEAVIQATQPRQPCFKLGFRFNNNQIVQQFVDSGFSGVYVRILEKGKVKTGDIMKRMERKNSLSIRKVYELLYTSEFQKEAVEMAVNDPFLAESCRKDLLKRWGDEI